jgi:hypothetical protein
MESVELALSIFETDPPTHEVIEVPDPPTDD